MVVERPLAVGRGGASEIQGAQAPGRDRRADHLHDVGIVALGRVADSRCNGGDVDRAVGQRNQGSAHIVGLQRRQVTLDVDNDADIAAHRAERLEDAVRARGVIGAGHQGTAAGLLHRRGDGFGIGGDHHRPDRRRLGAAQHMDHHGQAGDIGEWLARKPVGGHAGRDQDENVGHRTARSSTTIGRKTFPGYTVARHEANRLFLRPPSLARHARRAAPARCLTVSSGSRSPSMDSFELNKILGAILGTCLFLLALNIAAGAMFAPRKPAKPGYDIAVVEQPAGGGGAAGAPQQEEPIEQRLASASPERGETAAKKCQACHTFNKGEPNRVGPNLYGVVGRDRASAPGFNYSAAMKAKGGKWTVDELDHFLTNPRGFIPGTSMTFAGLPRGNERADVITYLNTKSDHPAPLPKAAEAPSPGPQTR